MKDEFKRTRKLLRPGYSTEFRGKHDKTINRRISRKKMKESFRREWF